MCSKRYHFIVKADGNSVGGYTKPCRKCGGEVNLAEPRCKSCNHVMTSDDIEEWIYHQLEDTTHLLHGVVHANGYGHLLRVNGREGGSRVLSGSHIMDFWDRLCKYLGVRLGLLIVHGALIFLYFVESKVLQKGKKFQIYECLEKSSCHATVSAVYEFLHLLFLMDTCLMKCISSSLIGVMNIPRLLVKHIV